jgi:choline-glycine betaine transporter
VLHAPGEADEEQLVAAETPGDQHPFTRWSCEELNKRWRWCCWVAGDVGASCLTLRASGFGDKVCCWCYSLVVRWRLFVFGCVWSFSWWLEAQKKKQEKHKEKQKRKQSKKKQKQNKHKQKMKKNTQRKTEGTKKTRKPANKGKIEKKTRK